MTAWKPLALISADYLEEQRRLHAAPRGYGGRGRKWAEMVQRLIDYYDARSVLDYGCGQGTLAIELRTAHVENARLDIRQYDPAISGKEALPEPADLVVCTDVLEHVEPDRIWNVCEHLADLTRCAALIVVSLTAGNKQLSDGSPAHILIRSREWWRTQLQAHGFVIREEHDIRSDKQFVVVVERHP